MYPKTMNHKKAHAKIYYQILFCPEFVNLRSELNTKAYVSIQNTDTYHQRHAFS